MRASALIGGDARLTRRRAFERLTTPVAADRLGASVAASAVSAATVSSKLTIRPRSVSASAVSGASSAGIDAPTFSLVAAPTAAAATTIAIPTVIAGDIITICARRASNTPASVPAAAGTVPTWVTDLTGGADTLSAVTVHYTVTQAFLDANGQPTSGTFTNAAQLDIVCIRGDRAIAVGASAQVNGGVLSTDVVYPALTRQSAALPAIIRFAVRANTGGDAAMLTPPSGYTLGAGISTAPAPVIVSHYRLSSGANPTADTQAMTAPFAYRAHTIEIKEA